LILGFFEIQIEISLVENLEVIVGMYSQKIFTLENFPYQEVFEEKFTTGNRGWYLA